MSKGKYELSRRDLTDAVKECMVKVFPGQGVTFNQVLIYDSIHPKEIKMYLDDFFDNHMGWMRPPEVTEDEIKKCVSPNNIANKYWHRFVESRE